MISIIIEMRTDFNNISQIPHTRRYHFFFLYNKWVKEEWRRMERKINGEISSQNVVRRAFHFFLFYSKELVYLYAENINKKFFSYKKKWLRWNRNRKIIQRIYKPQINKYKIIINKLKWIIYLKIYKYKWMNAKRHKRKRKAKKICESRMDVTYDPNNKLI